MIELQDLIGEVRSHLRDKILIYRHKWQKGDLLIWDNHILQHARSPSYESLPRIFPRTPIV